MFNFQVAPDNGDEYPLVADSRDVYRWEKSNRGKTVGQLLEDMNMTDLYDLAWRAARRQGHFDGTLAEFVDTCAIKNVDDAQEDVDPTRQARSTGPASTSPSPAA